MAVNTIQDSRVSSIMINLNVTLNANFIAKNYAISASKIDETQKNAPHKTYSTVRQTLRESYLTGSVKYGNNFIM